jgi:hypothetical protein
MHNPQTKIEQVRDLAAQVDLADRLAMIRAIAALESRPNLSEADDFAEALTIEQENWFALPATIRQRYGDDYVAVYRGAVIDHDPDRRTLYVRVRAKHGRVPILIVAARWEAPPVFSFHSTQLES